MIYQPRFHGLRCSVPKEERTCALRRCGRVFLPAARNQKYCTRDHERIARTERSRNENQ